MEVVGMELDARDRRLGIAARSMDIVAVVMLIVHLPRDVRRLLAFANRV
jgi:hypothetical protein